MSRRSRDYRSLAGRLSRHAGGVDVMARFIRDRGIYEIKWHGGPTVGEMQKHAEGLIGNLESADLLAAMWVREPQ